MAPADASYFSEIDIFAYDRTVVAHPLMDQLRGGVLAAVARLHGVHPARIVDVGAGSGQMTRMLLGFPWLEVTALDCDDHARQFFSSHPEMSAVPFLHLNVMDLQPGPKFDVAVCVGVFHHVPKRHRSAFLKKLLGVATTAVVADEFLADYATAHEREVLCRRWYEWVIAESSRRGIDELARLETSFMSHDIDARGDDAGDFKESLSHFRENALDAGAKVISELVYGDWTMTGGGMGVLTIEA